MALPARATGRTGGRPDAIPVRTETGEPAWIRRSSIFVTILCVCSPADKNEKRGVMTYCLVIILPEGLELASDSRSNARFAHVARVRRFELITLPLNPVIPILSAVKFAPSPAA